MWSRPSFDTTRRTITRFASNKAWYVLTVGFGRSKLVKAACGSRNWLWLIFMQTDWRMPVMTDTHFAKEGGNTYLSLIQSQVRPRMVRTFCATTTACLREFIGMRFPSPRRPSPSSTRTMISSSSTNRPPFRCTRVADSDSIRSPWFSTRRWDTSTLAVVFAWAQGPLWLQFIIVNAALEL